MTLLGSLTLAWNDTRVKITGRRESDGSVILDRNCLKVLWTPDVWIEFLGSFDRQQVMGDLSRFIISKDHELNYWQRFNILP